MDKQLARIDREVSNFKGLIDMWDVINETVIMPVFDKYDNAVTRICNRYGRIELIKKVFDASVINPASGNNSRNALTISRSDPLSTYDT